MTKLDCAVTGCAYNDEKCCCKGDITVEGRNAEESHGTCCGSFKEAGENRAKNVACHPSKSIEVDCEAEHCIYNEKCKCTAEHIGIAGGNACTCGETACSSFSAK